MVFQFFLLGAINEILPHLYAYFMKKIKLTFIVLFALEQYNYMIKISMGKNRV